MKRFLLTLTHLLSSTILLYAQESIRPEISVIPPSPNAAAINKFVDVPVSFYTGTPNVSIPLFTLQVEGMSLPITLDYHASGLKVEEKASNVGAGWRLNAGGVITRSVHGLADEVYTDETFNAGEQRGWFQTTFAGSLFNGSSLNWTWINGCSSYGTGASDGTTSKPIDPLDHLAGGNWDLEPDMYHLSYPGGSSKFIFERDGDLFELMEDDIVFSRYPFTSDVNSRCTGCPPITQNIDPTNTDYSFVVGDMNGVSYTYEDVERSTATSGCFPNDPSDNNGVSNRQSAWYLSRMSVSNRFIDFHYQDETIIYESDFYQTQQFKVPGTTGTVDPTASTCLNDMLINGKRLDYIESTNGYRIEFIASTNERNDLDGSHSINEVIVKHGGLVIKHYKLVHSYFGNNTKLRLDEVKIVNPNDTSQVLNRYTLDYFTGIFPAADSKDQDYWGFYNGASNTSMIPEWKNEDYHVNSLTTVDRNPDLLSAKVGTLKKITYPTGGYTSFDYELNDFYDPEYDFTYNYSVSASGGTEMNPVEDIQNFTVNENCTATLNIILPQGGLDGVARLEKYNGSSYVLHTPAATQGNRVVLLAGDYRLFASSESSNEYSAEIEFEQKGIQKFVSAGGLRIQKMTFHDPVTNKDEYRFYEYSESDGGSGKQSSGKLYTDPRIAGYITTATTGTVGQTCQEDGGSVTQFVNLSQISQVPLAVSHGSPVGYTQVQTYKLETEPGIQPPINAPYNTAIPDNLKTNGQSVYVYTNAVSGSQMIFPPIPPEDLDYKNGKLAVKTDLKLTASNDLNTILKEENSYEDAFLEDGVTTQSITAYMFRKAVSRTCYSCIPSNTIYATYQNYRRWNRLQKKIETSFENVELKKTTDFAYELENGSWPHHQTKSVTTKTSLDEEIVFNFERDPNKPGLIIMLTELKEGVLNRAELVSYNTNLPISYKTWDGVSSDLQAVGSFIEKQHIIRNSEGEVVRVIENPTETSFNNDISKIYIRSYGERSLVVAEISGISQNDLDALLVANNMSSIIDDLANKTITTQIEYDLTAIRQVLAPHHLMTTFLYDDSSGGRHGPTTIIGSNEVTTKYIYDVFGRLTDILDEDNNLVRKVSYNFKNN
ncbi:hypothetical protein [Ekhidna sp.]|uniref:hypothetical protein n=1 Tax=Ekhidna sp. TaxID=2608089 RepID=UPI0032990F14